MEQEIYKYRSRLGWLIFGIIFFGGVGIEMLYFASINYRNNPKWFYYIFSIASFIFVGAGLIGIGLRIFIKQQIILNATSIIIPCSRWSNKVQEINYGNITLMSEFMLVGNRVLRIFHKGGEATINNQFLSNKKEYDVIKCFLSNKVTECLKQVGN